MSVSVPQKVARRFKAWNAPLPLNDFEGYDGYWDDRNPEATDEQIHNRWKLAVAHIPDGASVLDVGCGVGTFMQYLKSERPNVTVTGTDVSQRAVDICRSKGLDAFRADLTTEPLEGRYDYITGFEIIEHVHEAERLLVTMRDATAERLILSLPNTGYIEHRMRLALFGRFPNTQILLHAKEHIRFWTAKDFRDWAAHFGLRVVSVEGQWGLPFLPWRRRPKLFAPQVVYTLVRAS